MAAYVGGSVLSGAGRRFWRPCSYEGFVMTRLRTGPSKGASKTGASKAGGEGKGRAPGARSRQAAPTKFRRQGRRAQGETLFRRATEKGAPETEAVDPARAARLARESAEKFQAAEAAGASRAGARQGNRESANPARHRGRGRHAPRPLVQAALSHAFAVASGENLPQGRGPARAASGWRPPPASPPAPDVRVPPLRSWTRPRRQR